MKNCFFMIEDDPENLLLHINYINLLKSFPLKKFKEKTTTVEIGV